MPVRVALENTTTPSHVSGANSRRNSFQSCSLLSVGQNQDPGISYWFPSTANSLSQPPDLMLFIHFFLKLLIFSASAAKQAFSGTQNVSSLQKDEAWRVNVRIQGCDLEHGYLCGTMEALNVPMADTPVVTFWEGEIVDTKNYTFFTGKWEAAPEDDIRHWTKFDSFGPLLGQVEMDGGKSADLSNYPYIFMRWKEQYFVNVGTDCGLTIAGFYYVCFSCNDGSISGFYYDPNSRPNPGFKMISKLIIDPLLGFPHRPHFGLIGLGIRVCVENSPLIV
ncbi:hypothetical protein L195_g019791, partial [Trifolium pratense]